MERQERALRRAELAQELLGNTFLWEVVSALEDQARESIYMATDRDSAWLAATQVQQANRFHRLLRAVIADGESAVEEIRRENQRMKERREERAHDLYLAAAETAREEWFWSENT